MVVILLVLYNVARTSIQHPNHDVVHVGTAQVVHSPAAAKKAFVVESSKNAPPRNRRSLVNTTSSKQDLTPPRVTFLHPRRKGGLLHIIKTKFYQYQPDSPALVRARLQIFRAFVLPAMVHQTVPNFFWIVSVESDLPLEHRIELQAMLAPYPHFYLTNVMLGHKPVGGKDIFTELLDVNNNHAILTGDTKLLFRHVKEYKTCPVLETRIDSDEALHVAFVEKIQVQAQDVFGDNNGSTSVDWMYWCINRAMEWQWFGPGSPSGLRDGAYLDNSLDEHVCAIPAMTVGFRQGRKTHGLYRTRAALLQKELAARQPSCSSGGEAKGMSCLRVWDELEYPVLQIESPTVAQTEKPDKKGKNETDRALDNGRQLAKQHFGTETEPVVTLNWMIRQIPPYYMNPPKVDRLKDYAMSVQIGQIDAFKLLSKAKLKNNVDKRADGAGKIVHVIKTRFMQHQPTLVELGKARVELFRTFCLPSMVHQSTQNFFWLIYADPLMPVELMDEMITLLKLYPHYYLVSSLDDKRGDGGKDIMLDIKPQDFKTGDTGNLYAHLGNDAFPYFLESRLDADDAININWIEEVQRRANQVFDEEEESRDWMYWCINRAMEWNWIGPGDRKPLQQFGALVHAQPYDERHFCHTPGMTLGLKLWSTTNTVKNTAHHLLYEELEKEKSPCGGNHSGTDCITFIGNFSFAALRSRTPTSASMSSVNNKGGKTYRLAAEEGAERWENAIKMFALLPNNTKHINAYFFQHMKPILEDNLRGQCTTGHSCREEARASLNTMIQLYTLNETLT
eukprot:scaffold3199_cov165-Amphora_coffeaeformis.AAC.3